MENNIITINPTEKMPTPGREMVEQDFESARQNLLSIIKNGQAAIEQLSLLADQSQNDKHYAALSALMKTVVDANEKLLDIQQKIRNVTRDTQSASKVINNNLIITTDQLHQMIKGNK
jgi:hypothetical protein